MIGSYSPHTVRRCSGDQNFRDSYILQRQPDEVSRIGCQAGMRVHQHSGYGAAHSTGTAQLAQRFPWDDEQKNDKTGLACPVVRPIRSGEGANRQRVILIVHLHLNAITLLDLSHYWVFLSHAHGLPCHPCP